MSDTPQIIELTDGIKCVSLEDYKKLQQERDEAREAFAIATSNCADAQQRLRAARDRCWRRGRERNYWKRDCLEQCKLLAMGADREEKLLQQVAALKSQISNLKSP